MSAVSAYLHVLDGRLRVKGAGVKGSPQKALEIERQLQMRDGISQVTTNPTTGSILVHYDSRRIKQQEVLKILNDLGCLQEHHRARSVSKNTEANQPGFGQELVQTVVRSTMEFALQRLVFALI